VGPNDRKPIPHLTRIKSRGPYERRLHLAFSRDCNFLASGIADETVRLWNLTGLTDLTKQPPCSTLMGHNGWVNTLVFQTEGYLLASGSDDNTIRF
jgi:WD40 repeat protein